MLKELRRKLITPESFGKALDVLSMMSEMIQVKRFGELNARRVSKVAKDARLTFYDATYLTLAAESNEVLVSNDNLLGKRADGMGVKTLAA